MKKFLSFFLATACLLLSTMQLNAQTKSVRVNVADSYGPVVGAAVQVKGTTIGAATDMAWDRLSTSSAELLQAAANTSA